MTGNTGKRRKVMKKTAASKSRIGVTPKAAVKKKVATKKVAPKKKSTARKRVPPVAKTVTATEHEPSLGRIGQDREAMIALEGPAEITRDDIEIIDPVKFKDKAAIESFMHEPLTILIHTSPEKFPEDPVQLGVNGKMIYIWRNQRTIVKRFYVSCLARARAEGVMQDPGDPDPKIANKLHITAGLRYPFSVLEDKNPLGQEWLVRECAQAT